MKTWLVAHRGASNEARENTIAAFSAAHTYPVGLIEFDVRVTKDNIAVIHHNPTINGLEIGTHTLAELQAEDPELTTFGALAQMSNLPLLIELKANASASHVIDYMHQHPESYATSFLEQELLVIKAAGIDPARLFLAQHNHPIGLVARASDNQFGGISVNKWYALPWLYHKATRRHLNVMFYTVNSKLIARYIRKYYPDAFICTDDLSTMSTLI